MKTFATMIGIAACLCSFAQSSVNLVPNPSFEDSIACTNTAGTYRPNSWFSPSWGSPDYFLQSSIGNFGCLDSTPSRWGGGRFTNQWGEQTPHTGNTYVGFGVPVEYLRVKLSNQLVQGKSYALSFYASLAESSNSGIDLIEVSLMINSIVDYQMPVIARVIPTLEVSGGNAAGNFLTDTLNWVLITDTIVANGGEEYLTIGALDTANIQYVLVDSNATSNLQYSYYYIDDVDLHCIDCIASIPTTPPITDKGNLFPNPSNNGQLNLEGAYAPNSRIEVLGMNGQLLFTKQLQPGQTSQIIDASTLPSGMYFYSIIENDTRSNFGKLVIQR